MATCYCAAIPSIPTTTRVVFLQHTRERDMPIGTARMASLALPNSKLHVGVHWDDHAELRAALSNPDYPPILLYPGNDAKDILVEPPDHPVTLVVVDGTWSQAKSIVRDNPILQALPRYAFQAPELSRYRIRKEPRDEYCSTIEAVMHVLGALEHDREKFRALMVPFELMVDRQLAIEATFTQGGRDETRVRRLIHKRHSPIIPTIVTDTLARWDRLVCVIAEANAFPYEANPNHLADEAVHVLACRMADGALFETVIAPRGSIAPSTPFHLAIPEQDLRDGVSLAVARDQLAGFLRADDALVSWGHFGFQLLAREDFALPSGRVDLRECARRKVNRVTPLLRVSGLEPYATGLGSESRLGRGRGGRRLGMLCDILRSWRDN